RPLGRQPGQGGGAARGEPADPVRLVEPLWPENRTMMNSTRNRIAFGRFAAVRSLALLLALLLAGCGGKEPDALLALAKAEHQKGDRNAAVLQLKSLLQEDPDHAESRLHLGLL